ncbi:hypothetical protein E3P99_00702 [Wallemia hederae]|uniref:RRM domain-containing protein n=1 Tax=Wallemia hederae TaxID=1540922 RepID=A0A4T0FTU8_9BASI|nr:hypothetical protein E3P99_00702 [Wallemia hederae]
MADDSYAYPPHPIVHAPKLHIQGLRSHTITNQEIASQLVGCLPARVAPHDEPEEAGIPQDADLQFKQLYAAEKALTLYSHLTFPGHHHTLELLPYSDDDRVVTIPQSVSTTPRIFRNLPPAITPHEVYDLCRKSGPIHSIKLINSGVAVVFAWDQDTSVRLEEDLHCIEYQDSTISVTKYEQSKESSHLHPKAAAFVPATNTGLHTPHTPSYFGHGPGQQVQYTGTNLVDPCNLFIKNLDQTLESNDLFDAFKSFGHIVSARVMRDENDQSRGFGFVSYQSPESAKTALHAMNGVAVRNKAVTVRFHEPKQLRQEKLAAKFAKNDRLGVGMGISTSQLASPLPSDCGLNSPPLSIAPSINGGRRGSGSYFKAALSSNTIPGLEEFKAMTLPMRNEMLGGHLMRALSDIQVFDADAVDRLMGSYGLDELVECLHNRDSLLRCYNGIPVETHLNALRIDSSVVGSAYGAPTAQDDTSRLIKAVQNLGESEYARIGEMLAGLGKKERAMCLFSNDYLIQKVRDAKVLLEVDDHDDEGGAAAQEDNDKQSAKDALNNAVNHEGAVNDDAFTETVQWFNSLQSLETKKQKQKIGEKLFKRVKQNGFKGNTAKLTVKLLDNEDLYSLTLLTEVYPSYLNKVVNVYSDSL